MKDIILKPGSFLEDKKTSHTNKIPGQSLEDFVVSVMKSATCCTKVLKNTTVVLPNLTTAQITALTGVAEGTLMYDTTLNKLKFYTGSAWETVTSA